MCAILPQLSRMAVEFHPKKIGCFPNVGVLQLGVLRQRMKAKEETEDEKDLKLDEMKEITKFWTNPIFTAQTRDISYRPAPGLEGSYTPATWLNLGIEESLASPQSG